MPRPAGFLLDVPPQPHDEVVDRARVGIFVHAPDVFEHRLARHRLAFVGRSRYRSRLASISVSGSVRSPTRSSSVSKSIVLPAKRVLVVRAPQPLGPAQQPADPREQDRQLRRLRQVVVGAGGKSAAARLPDARARSASAPARTASPAAARTTTAKPSLPGSITSRTTRSKRVVAAEQPLERAFAASRRRRPRTPPPRG